MAELGSGPAIVLSLGYTYVLCHSRNNSFRFDRIFVELQKCVRCTVLLSGILSSILLTISYKLSNTIGFVLEILSKLGGESENLVRHDNIAE